MLRACREGRIDLILCKSVSPVWAQQCGRASHHPRTTGTKHWRPLFEKEGGHPYHEFRADLAFHSAFLPIRVGVHQWQRPLGVRKAYENGTIKIGPNLYGFRREKDGPVLVDEEKAAVIRQIARWLLDGDSLHTIADKLAQRHIPSPKRERDLEHRHFTLPFSPMKSTRATPSSKDLPAQPVLRPGGKNDGILKKYYVEGVLPHILEPEVFDRVQEELAKRSAKRPTSESKNSFWAV